MLTDYAIVAFYKNICTLKIYTRLSKQLLEIGNLNRFNLYSNCDLLLNNCCLFKGHERIYRSRLKTTTPSVSEEKLKKENLTSFKTFGKPQTVTFHLIYSIKHAKHHKLIKTNMSSHRYSNFIYK